MSLGENLTQKLSLEGKILDGSAVLCHIAMRLTGKARRLEAAMVGAFMLRAAAEQLTHQAQLHLAVEPYARERFDRFVAKLDAYAADYRNVAASVTAQRIEGAEVLRDSLAAADLEGDNSPDGSQRAPRYRRRT